MEVPLAYLPGNVTRVKVTAVGDLLPPEHDAAGAIVWKKITDQESNIVEEGVASSVHKKIIAFQSVQILDFWKQACRSYRWPADTNNKTYRNPREDTYAHMAS